MGLRGSDEEGAPESGAAGSQAGGGEERVPERPTAAEVGPEGLARPPVRPVEIRPPSASREALRVAQAAGVVVCATWLYLANTVGPPSAGREGQEIGGGQTAPGGTAPAPGETGRLAAAQVSSATRQGGPGSALGTVGEGSGPASDRNLMPFQRLFRSLGPHEQRMFRELQEGLLEAENVRAGTGRWPEAAELAARGVPPFAAGPVAPIAAKERYAWSRRQEGPLVNYLGVAAGGSLPSFLLLIQEPDPPDPPDQSMPSDPAAGRAAFAAAGGDEQHHRLPDGRILHVSTWMRAGSLPRAASVIAIPYASGWTQLLAGASSPVPR
jgi:hypothetical protein